MNNRKNERHHVLKTGTISFQGSRIDCAVHDISVEGAKLEVDSDIGIPDSFDLLMHSESSQQRCQVVWRKQTRIGVAFFQECGDERKTKLSSNALPSGLANPSDLARCANRTIGWLLKRSRSREVD